MPPFIGNPVVVASRVKQGTRLEAFMQEESACALYAVPWKCFLEACTAEMNEPKEIKQLFYAPKRNQGYDLSGVPL